MCSVNLEKHQRRQIARFIKGESFARVYKNGATEEHILAKSGRSGGPCNVTWKGKEVKTGIGKHMKRGYRDPGSDI